MAGENFEKKFQFTKKAAHGKSFMSRSGFSSTLALFRFGYAFF